MTINDILDEMISIKSINPPGLENEMCNYVYNLLKDNSDETIKVNIDSNRYNIISKINGVNSNKGIIFSGHMDVVPVSNEELLRWNTDPFKPIHKNGFIYGRGSADMKSGLAAGIYAFIDTYNSNIKPNTDIFLVATVDEEDFMQGSKLVYNHPMLSNAQDVIIMEPTNLNICNIGRGRTYGEITFLGKTGHGSQYTANNNTILMANYFISEMLKEKFEENKYGISFWQPVSINAGVEPCVVPDKTTLKIDARLNPDHNPDDIWNRVDKILNKLNTTFPNSNQSINIIDKRQGFTNENSKILNTTIKSLKDINITSKKSIFMGTTDGCQFLKNNRNIIIIGPGDLSTVHMENEKVSEIELETAYELYLKIIKNYK